MSRIEPRSQVAIGTRNPAFGRSTISAGSTDRATSLTTHLVTPCLSFTLDGSEKASSTRSWSRNGGLSSREAAIDMRSPRSSKLSANQAWQSANNMRRTGSPSPWAMSSPGSTIDRMEKRHALRAREGGEPAFETLRLVIAPSVREERCAPDAVAWADAARPGR